jgi:hypothetical protein
LMCVISLQSFPLRSSSDALNCGIALSLTIVTHDHDMFIVQATDVYKTGSLIEEVNWAEPSLQIGFPGIDEKMTQI